MYSGCRAFCAAHSRIDSVRLPSTASRRLGSIPSSNRRVSSGFPSSIERRRWRRWEVCAFVLHLAGLIQKVEHQGGYPAIQPSCIRWRNSSLEESGDICGVMPNAKITDRRWQRALAANPASDLRGPYETATRGGGSGASFGSAIQFSSAQSPTTKCTKESKAQKQQ